MRLTRLGNVIIIDQEITVESEMTPERKRMLDLLKNAANELDIQIVTGSMPHRLYPSFSPEEMAIACRSAVRENKFITIDSLTGISGKTSPKPIPLVAWKHRNNQLEAVVKNGYPKIGTNIVEQ